MESYIIRIMRVEEIDFLKEMLFEAIFLPQEIKNELSKDIINQPELKKYFIDWGRPGDLAYVAETSDKELKVDLICNEEY
jgi:predicted nucleic acid-binding protein